MINIGRTTESFQTEQQKRFQKIVYKLMNESEEFKYIYIDGVRTHFIVSNFGRVLSLEYAHHKNVIKSLAYQLNRDGHIAVTLNFNGKSYSRRVHRLVAQAFVPNPDNKPCVHHIDGDHLNNLYTNLMWVTENEHSQLTKELGQKAHNYAFSENQVRDVCELLTANEYDISMISKITTVPIPIIKKIIFENYRNNITDDYDIETFKSIYTDYAQFARSKYTKDQIISVCEMLSSKQYTYKEISDITKVSVSVIKSIYLRKRWLSISKDYQF